MVQEDYPLAFNDGRPRGGDNDSINSRIVSQVESVLSENLKTIAPTNAKKAQIRLNMGYRMPRFGYLKSFWLLPPQWQKERPADLPIGSDDLAINEAQLEFVKHRVTQASEKLVSQIKKLQGGPYQGAKSTPETQCDKMQNVKKSTNETLPQFMYKLQNLFTGVEIETGQELVD
ncbi:hypothetical protein Pmar_PMAR012762, partial [Perkinsus marinus ATCC 50983]